MATITPPPQTSAPGQQPAGREPATTPTAGGGWSIALGILLLVGGGVAIAFPFLSSIAITIYVGWLLVVAGLFRVVHASAYGSAENRLWNVLIGFVLLGGGIVLLLDPLAGALTLTVLLAAVFAVEGSIEIAAAFGHRTQTWGWTLVNGFAGLLAAAIIAFGLPGTALWVVGLVAGARFIVSGIRTIAEARPR